MNCGNMEKSIFMKQVINCCSFFLLLITNTVLSQTTKRILTLDSIIKKINDNNLLLQSYELKASAYEYNGVATTAWMPPMVGMGTFMTPYPGNKVMDTRDKGNVMVEIEQDIPNVSRQQAKRRYIESQANIEKYNRDIKSNELKAQARRLYYTWLIAKNKISVLEKGDRIMNTMKKIEQVRYPYNQSQLANVYTVDARIEENRNMIRMQQSVIAKTKAWLNGLMNLPGDNDFDIDSLYVPHFAPEATHDTASLAAIRKDIGKMNESINSMKLGIESMKSERKPDFRVRIDHMNPLSGSMPKVFNIMGMISVPIVPWSSKMYKSEIKAMEYNIKSVEKERDGMLQQTQGMLYGMQSEIKSMHERVLSMEQKVIPTLQKAMDANFANYQENKLSLSVVIDSWEALNMMQLNVLDEKLKHYEMIIEYEKQLFQ